MRSLLGLWSCWGYGVCVLCWDSRRGYRFCVLCWDPCWGYGVCVLSWAPPCVINRGWLSHWQRNRAVKVLLLLTDWFGETYLSRMKDGSWGSRHPMASRVSSLRNTLKKSAKYSAKWCLFLRESCMKCNLCDCFFFFPFKRKKRYLKFKRTNVVT